MKFRQIVEHISIYSQKFEYLAFYCFLEIEFKKMEINSTEFVAVKTVKRIM